MSQQSPLINEYYSRDRDKVIDCPLQPGNLKISKKACTKRRQAASRIPEEPFKTENLFIYSITQGLLRCKQCPIFTD
jgi:hypothetical protein